MAALLNLEAEDAVHIKLYLTNISNGLVFEAVAVQIDLFSRLSHEAGHDHKLPEKVGLELAKQFKRERNELRKFRSSLRSVNEVGYHTLKTFKEQVLVIIFSSQRSIHLFLIQKLAPLDKPIKLMWYWPSSSSYEVVRTQMKKFCDTVDDTLSQLHRTVKDSSVLLRSIDNDLERLSAYLSHESRNLPGLKSIFRPYLSVLGLSLDHNIAKLETFAVQVGLTTNDLDALGNVLDKMAHSSSQLRNFFATALNTTVEDDLNLPAVLDKFKEYQSLLV
ncbi:hypothetical protein IW261DRAFT_1488804 [Armillaria novae-zelandiae]|uniref:Uncharacterized protein n=1 Tax=Armillaria novae-zelandiae TaxID=153914 RepID=A0AA39P3Z3_9AGAR|nr:hypothetical protein IW261DRAFT_1488804 [Armillaria novae-zelandiae]